VTDSSACVQWREALPWYTAGTLSAEVRAAVERHLASCPDCVRELAVWRALARSVQVEGRGVEPTLSFAASWEGLSVRLPASVGWSAAPRGAVWSNLAMAVGHLWQVIPAQARLLRRSVWIASAMAIVLAILYAATLPSHVGEQDVLAFALPLIAGTGVAFLYGPEIDPSLELALATPTSARAILFGRFALLFMYDALLALAGTTLLSVLHGDEFWALTLVWLGPTLLLSTISLALSLLLSPVVASGGAALLWLSRIAHFDNGLTLRITPAAFWSTTPQVLVISVVLLVLAVLYVPRQVRLVREE
jgi:Putative zinc-finger